MSSLDDCVIVKLPKVADPRGNLTFIEGVRHVPFVVQRAYWIYDVPGGEFGGGHACRTTDEFIVALSGSFDVELEDGLRQRVIPLNRPYNGLYVPHGIWRQLRNFSTNAVALMLASLSYDDNDYLRDHDEFERLRRAHDRR